MFNLFATWNRLVGMEDKTIAEKQGRPTKGKPSEYAEVRAKAEKEAQDSTEWVKVPAEFIGLVKASASNSAKKLHNKVKKHSYNGTGEWRTMLPGFEKAFHKIAQVLGADYHRLQDIRDIINRRNAQGF